MNLVMALCLLPLIVFGETDGIAAPDFTRLDARGHKVQLSKFKGKVVLLDFWATWCTGCKVEIPWFVEFAETYRKKGLAVVGVSMDEGGWKIVSPFLAETMNIPYPVVIGDDALAKQFGGIESMPVTVLIDRQGRVAYSHVGVVAKGQFEGEIQELLTRAR
ncbi:MAG: Redoxin domain protein [Bryobacterales bacterium]|nr:Redoxin domain protein [Bryobacterales bacterium]